MPQIGLFSSPSEQGELSEINLVSEGHSTDLSFDYPGFIRETAQDYLSGMRGQLQLQEQRIGVLREGLRAMLEEGDVEEYDSISEYRANSDCVTGGDVRRDELCYHANHASCAGVLGPTTGGTSPFYDGRSDNVADGDSVFGPGASYGSSDEINRFDSNLRVMTSEVFTSPLDVLRSLAGLFSFHVPELEDIEVYCMGCMNCKNS